MQTETIVFNGITFRRYPDSKRQEDQRYFKPSACDRRRGIESLHREIWKAQNGPIPKGYQIHHIDGDAGNNSITNLRCVKSNPHLSEHSKGKVKNPRGGGPKAAAWHGSDRGKEWHSEHAKVAWEGEEPTVRICQQCGKEYKSRAHGKSKYCSNSCKARAFRRDNPGYYANRVQPKRSEHS